MKAPMAFLFVYLIFSLLFSVPGLMAQVPWLMPGAMPGLGTGSAVGVLVFLAIGVPIGFGSYLVVMYIWAGILHGVSRMFGGQGSYAGSFRLVAYAQAPSLLFGLLSMVIGLAMGPAAGPNSGASSRVLQRPYQTVPYLRLARAVHSQGEGSGRLLRVPGRRIPHVSPQGPGNSFPYGQASRSPLNSANPIAMLLALVGLVVYVIYLGIGVYHVHNVCTGSAAGVAIVSAIAGIFIVFMLAMLLGVFVAAVLMGMRGAMH
jgi:hypothetical protein